MFEEGVFFFKILSGPPRRVSSTYILYEDLDLNYTWLLLFSFSVFLSFLFDTADISRLILE